MTYNEIVVLIYKLYEFNVMTTYLFFGKEPKEVTPFMTILMSVSDMCSENWLNAV